MGKLTDRIAKVESLAEKANKKLGNIRGTGVTNSPEAVVINPPQFAAPAPGSGGGKPGTIRRVDLLVTPATAGLAGDRTHKPAFKYTAYLPDTTTNPIATDLVPLFNRAYGRHLSAQHGIMDGTILVVCDEVPDTGPCTITAT